MNVPKKELIAILNGELNTIEKYKNLVIPKKVCKLCGNEFIPSVRSDEIYCDRIFKNGRTCKEVAYEENVKKSIFRKLYTTARKNQHARIRYHSSETDYKEKHYIPWKEAAEKALKYYESIGDIQGFENWIKTNKNSF